MDMSRLCVILDSTSSLLETIVKSQMTDLLFRNAASLRRF